MKCIKCNQDLILKKNWYPSFAEHKHYVCISCFLIQRKPHNQKYRKVHLEYDKNFKKKPRIETIKLLGSKCFNLDCPIPKEKLDIRTLEIDHVRGKGNKERASFSCTYSYYKFILEQVKNGSKDYQLLCPYCNVLKRIIKEERITSLEQ